MEILWLTNQGLSKIVLLGGSNLISYFLIEDLINELQITITPQLLGGNYCWVSAKLNNLAFGLANFRQLAK